MTYDEWVEQFKPIPNDDLNASFNGTMYETYGQDLMLVQGEQPNRVWTLLDSGHIIEGYHYINRMGYFITEVPWTQSYSIRTDQ